MVAQGLSSPTSFAALRKAWAATTELTLPLSAPRQAFFCDLEILSGGSGPAGHQDFQSFTAIANAFKVVATIEADLISGFP